MRKTFLIVSGLIIILTSQSEAQQVELSPDATISLLTCGPGAEMYSYFGHSALRVTDRANRINRVYNYGTFDFNIPDFYWQFVKGKMYYLLSVTRFEGFLNEYISENRYVRELPLMITPEEKQVLYELLEINYLPENRHYWYDFIKDNCTTRIRDIVQKATDSVYRWPEIAGDRLTFRQLILPYLKAHPWARTGILLLLTSGADQEASAGEYLFLPERMHQGFAGAETSSGRNLAGAERQIFTPVNNGKALPFLFHPYLVIGILAAVSLFLGLRKFRHDWFVRLWFSLLFLITGVLGSLFAFMWFCSAHWVCYANLNLAWAFPLHIILAAMIWFPKTAPVVRWYSSVMSVVVLLFLVTFVFWKQTVPLEGLLLAIATLSGLFRFSGLYQFLNPKPQDQAN